MSENKHTPEPWRTDVECGFPQDIHDSKGNLFLRCGSDFDNEIYGEANARRITACVNACAGIPTYQLTAENDNPTNLGEVIDAIRDQRDELLAALKSISKITGDAGFNIGGPLEHCPGEIGHDEAKRLLILACEYLKDTSKAAHRAIARAKGEQ